MANLLIATACAGVLLFLMGLFRLGTPGALCAGVDRDRLHQRHRGADPDLADQGLAGPGDRRRCRPTCSRSCTRWPRTSTPSTPTPSGSAWPASLGLFAWPQLLHDKTRFGYAVHLVLGRMAELRAVRAGSRVPGPIVALVTLTLVSWGFNLPVETIGTRFGGIPEGVPAFALPEFSWETVKQLVTPTLTIALLGAIESLLCARVADQAQRPAAPRPEPGADGAGHRQLRHALLRRHAGHRHHRAHRDQRARRRQLARRGHRARAHAAGGGAGGGAARAACAAGGAGRHPALRGLEHGRVARVLAVHAAPLQPALPAADARHLLPHGGVRPHGGGAGRASCWPARCSSGA